MNHPLVVLDELSSSLAVSDPVGDLVYHSVSENTRRAYRYALKKFRDWLCGPAVSDQTISEYLAELHEAGKSPQTCNQVVAAIKFVFKLGGKPSPVGPLTGRVLAGIRRTGRGRGRGQVQGVNWGQADAAVVFAEKDGALADVRDAAIIAVASDAMLRVSEVAALRVDDSRLRVGRFGHGHHPVEQDRPGRHRSGSVSGGSHRGPDPGVASKGRHPGRTRVPPRFCERQPRRRGENARGQPPQDHQEAVRGHRHPGAGFGPFVARGRGAVAGRRRGDAAGNADRRALDVAVDARPLRTRAAGRQGCRGEDQVFTGRPLN